MFKNVILFPHKLGQVRTGVQKTPDIMKHFLNIKNISRVSSKNCLFKNLENLYKYNQNHLDPILNIGGDHSMSIATVASSLNKYDNLKVIWFDAHADLNTYSSSQSKSYHGMPLSFLTGLDNDHRFNFIKRKLNFNNLFYVGIRELDSFEKEIIDRYRIKYITVKEMENSYKCINLLNEFISDDPVHISFDVDCIDISEIISTGTPVKDGLNIEPTKQILSFLKNKNVVNVDLTELNLDIGDTNQKFMSLANTLYLFDDFLH